MKNSTLIAIQDAHRRAATNDRGGFFAIASEFGSISQAIEQGKPRATRTAIVTLIALLIGLYEANDPAPKP